MIKKPKDGIFYSVALATIVSGAAIAAIGFAFWILNVFKDYSFFMPSEKVIGGAIICALGYIVLELELIRGK